MSISFIIQGFLTQETYDFYSEKYPDIHKVFSTWTDTNVTFFDYQKQKILINNNPKKGFGRQNLNLQVFSTMKGLELVNTKYVIKLRGDEKYSNLESLLHILSLNDFKTYTVPVFFRKWNNYAFHISDHLIAGTTENLKLMFNESWKTITCSEKLKKHTLFRNSAETIICKSYLDAKTGLDLGVDEKSKELFKNYFDIIQLDKLSPYQVSFVKQKTQNFDPKNFNSISDMSEL